jgi:hypothetical protein
VGSFLRRHFLEADTRGLAIFRILFGLGLLGYLVTRVTGDSFYAFHTNLGVYPNHYGLFNPHVPYTWSFLSGASVPSHVAIALALMGLVFLCFTLGYRTWLASVLSLLCLVSLHHRMPLVVNGSMVAMHIVMVWALALPLGRHYSVDAWLLRRRGEGPARLRGERVTSLGVLGFRLQLACIYAFNVLHKTGETWMEGSAVHYVLWQDRIAMAPAVWVRENAPVWGIQAATYGTLVVESVIAVCLLLPLFPKHARRVAFGAMLLLHWGIGMMVQLGPFPFVFPAAGVLMMASGDWSTMDRWIRRVVSERFGPAKAREGATPRPPQPPVAAELAAKAKPRRWLRWGAVPTMREIYYAAAIVIVAVIIRHDNPFLKAHLGEIRLPRAALWAGQTFYIPQGWALFAPEAPKYDGRLVIDAVLADGTRIDPLRHEPPEFDVMDKGPYHTDYFWQTYQPVLVGRRNADLWRFFMDYVQRIPDLEQWEGERRVVYVAAYYSGGQRPGPWGDSVPPPKVELHAVRGVPPAGHAVPAHVPMPPKPNETAPEGLDQAPVAGAP